MELSIREIAELVDGELLGSGDSVVKGVAPLDRAGPEDISFAVSEKYRAQVGQTHACAVLVPLGFQEPKKTLVRVKNPYLAMAKVSTLLHTVSEPVLGISQMAYVGNNFKCGTDISVYPGAFIGDDVTVGNGVTLHPGVILGKGVELGDDVVIHPNVSILERCRIGSRVVIHAGTVIGSDGFGHAPDGDRYHKIPQTGIVRIDGDVEIGACNTIDRATFGATWIKRGVKTDNQVHIAHNVVVGENTLLVAQVAIAGSVTIGHNTILAGQVGVAQHLTIGNRVIIGPRSGIGKSVPDGEIVSGAPGMPHRLWLKTSNIIKKLPDMKMKLKSLEERIKMLEEALGRNEK
jgi:UDP-3-O-[3-hydroxymyristoyl] glucosamine N-acyltransferase